jgi:hypothetical protein
MLTLSEIRCLAMASKTLGFRLPEETWKKLEAEAQSKGMSMTDLARQKVMLATDFEGPVQALVDHYSSVLNISRHEVVEAILTDYVAMHQAHADVWGSGKLILEEFTFTEQGVMRGQLLFELRKAVHTQEFKREKVKMLLKEEKMIGRDRMSKADREWLNANLHLVHLPQDKTSPKKSVSQWMSKLKRQGME